MSDVMPVPALACAHTRTTGRAVNWGRRFGQLPSTPIEYLHVAPTAVVELDVDTAFENHRWRHGVRFVRIRPDLRPGDLPTGTTHQATMERWLDGSIRTPSRAALRHGQRSGELLWPESNMMS